MAKQQHFRTVGNLFSSHKFSEVVFFFLLLTEVVVILSSARDATAVGFIPGQPGTGLEPFSFFNSCGLVVLRNDDFHKKARKASVHGPRLWPWAWCEERQLVRLDCSPASVAQYSSQKRIPDNVLVSIDLAGIPLF